MKTFNLFLLFVFISCFTLSVFAAEEKDDDFDFEDDDLPFEDGSETGSKICDKAIEKMKEYHDEIDKDPKCSFDEDYAKDHNLEGVYTTSLDNRVYYCTKCINKFNAAGLAMYKMCGKYAPEDFLYRVQFMYFVEQMLCLRAAETMKEKKVKDFIFCQAEVERMKKLEGDKPFEEWSEEHLCSECVPKLHYILKHHEHFYQLLTKNNETTPFSSLLPIYNLDKECFKKWEPKRPQQQEKQEDKNEDKKENAETKKEETKKEETKKEETKKEETEKKETKKKNKDEIKNEKDEL